MPKYIYGIINSDCQKSFGRIGMDNGEIYSVQFEDMGVIVSDIGENCCIGRAEARIHDDVLRKIMEPHTVIPMRFGAIAKDDEEIRNILKHGRMKLKKTMEKVDHKLQINVKISWDKGMLLNILNQNAEIRKLVNENKENANQSHKIELGKRVKAELDQRKIEYLEGIARTLKSLSVDSEENKIIDQETLLDAAFLIDKSREQDFYDKLNELEKKHVNYLKFISVGPLPAYNFAKIGVKKINFDSLEEARKTMGLSQEVSISEINMAYNSLARRYHPDLHPDDPSCEKMFKKIREAQALLTKYCEHYLCSITKTDVEENIVIEEKAAK